MLCAEGAPLSVHVLGVVRIWPLSRLDLLELSSVLSV